MTNISNQEWFQSSPVQEFMNVFVRGGKAGSARFVGGCVRNSLMGIAISDIDVATTLLPEKVKSIFEHDGYVVIPTGLQHGTVTVMIDHVPFEVTTLRRDVETDGRWATVEFVTDWKYDAERRDFRINALYADFEGEIHDPLGGGIEDIAIGKVTFVGDPEKRIEEDALRILRFFRFTARYSKTWIDEDGLRACSKLAHTLKNISAERISTEMMKILATPNCRFVLRDMEMHGVIQHAVPNFVNLDLVHGLYYQQALHGMPEPDALLRLRAMLPNNKERILEASKGLRLTLKERKRLTDSVITDGASVVNWSERSVRNTVYKIGKQAFKDQYLLIWSGRSNKKPRMTVLDYVDQWEIPTMPINGDDLIAMGIKTGKPLGTMLKSLEDQWVESDFTMTHDQLREKVNV